MLTFLTNYSNKTSSLMIHACIPMSMKKRNAYTMYAMFTAFLAGLSHTSENISHIKLNY